MSKQTIDFSVPNPKATANYSLPHFEQCRYDDQYKSWNINGRDGLLQFKLKLPKKQGVNLIFQLCSSSSNGKTDCPVDITVNGKPFVSGFDPHITKFYDMVWSVPENMLEAGDNDIKFSSAGGSTNVFMRHAVVDIYSAPVTKKNWLQTIPDTTLISEINFPGTHDAAAINTTIHTPYSCHNESITSQLNGGIRLLDVRLKVKQSGSTYYFQTCHGDKGSSVGANEYQSFVSLMDECKNFLAANQSETILMSLKIDDWNGFSNHSANVYTALTGVLSHYPMLSTSVNPELGQIRNHILMLNRITDDLRFGIPMDWTDNTPGSYANQSSHRFFNMYVQDQYKELSTIGSQTEKFNLVTAAFVHKKAGEVLLNFASATWFGIIGVYIMGDLLDYFGKTVAASRKAKLGWLLFDYEFEKYVTDTYGSVDITNLIIASNFNYSGFEHAFKVIRHDEL